MADIRSYIKEKEKREQKQASYKDKIFKHKLTSVYRIALVAVGVAALVALVVVQYRRRVYTDYDTVSSVARENASGAVDVRLGNSILTYSRDGAHCTNAKGEVSWNQTYQIQDVCLSIYGDTVAIADYNGRNIYIMNTEKQLGTITTNMPIRDISVSSGGYVTAVLADTDMVWIYTYDVNGKEVAHGTAKMDGAGYPGALSLSPSGELLGIAYVYVDAGVLQTTVAFYNFGDVGDNQIDSFVSSWSYRDMLVPVVQFMNDRTVFAVGDGRIMFFSGNHKPVSLAEKLFDEEVQSVYYNENYVGLVFRSQNSSHLYHMDVYDTSGQIRNNFDLDIEYTDLFFDNNNIVAYNETECVIMTMDGLEKFSGNFSKSVRLMLPGSGAYRYILVTDSSIDTIQLK